jgi:hypothetical protein
MTINIPDELRDEIERKARTAGFDDVGLYVAALVIEDEPIPPDELDLPGPPEIAPRNREELERMLEEGLNSGPPIRVTPEFWEERRRVLEERMARRRGEST